MLSIYLSSYGIIMGLLNLKLLKKKYHRIALLLEVQSIVQRVSVCLSVYVLLFIYARVIDILPQHIERVVDPSMEIFLMKGLSQ